MNIVFFDDQCPLCIGFVKHAMRHDDNKKLKFSPIQGSLAVSYLTESERNNLSTIVFIDTDNHRRFLRSQAVFKIFYILGGVHRWLAVFDVLPQFLTDKVYLLVARYRYQVFSRGSKKLNAKELTSVNYLG